jgi:hypothetical protein
MNTRQAGYLHGELHTSIQCMRCGMNELLTLIAGCIVGKPEIGFHTFASFAKRQHKRS